MKGNSKVLKMNEIRQKVRILVVDNHAIVCSGIASILSKYQEFEVVALAGSGQEALSWCEQYQPDVVLMDIDLPGEVSGVELVRRLSGKDFQIPVIVLTNNAETATIQEAMQGGATSYLLKNISVDELAHAVHSADRGISTLSPQVTQALIQAAITPSQDSSSNHLTRREQQVLELVSQGFTNHEIAVELSISFSTVQFHVRNILAKLGVHNRIEAATIAVRQGVQGHKDHPSWMVH